jgi:hypothetical protein
MQSILLSIRILTVHKFLNTKELPVEIFPMWENISFYLDRLHFARSDKEMKIKRVSFFRGFKELSRDITWLSILAYPLFEVAFLARIIDTYWNGNYEKVGALKTLCNFFPQNKIFLKPYCLF